jgi:hypothetical protein
MQISNEHYEYSSQMEAISYLEAVVVVVDDENEE